MDNESMRIIQQAVEVSVQRAIQRVSVPKFFVGVVLDVDNPLEGIHSVQLDGDTETIAAHNVSEITFAVGDQAAVVFVPPHQFWIIGRIVPHADE